MWRLEDGACWLSKQMMMCHQANMIQNCREKIKSTIFTWQSRKNWMTGKRMHMGCMAYTDLQPQNSYSKCTLVRGWMMSTPTFAKPGGFCRMNPKRSTTCTRQHLWAFKLTANAENLHGPSRDPLPSTLGWAWCGTPQPSVEDSSANGEGRDVRGRACLGWYPLTLEVTGKRFFFS